MDFPYKPLYSVQPQQHGYGFAPQQLQGFGMPPQYGMVPQYGYGMGSPFATVPIHQHDSSKYDEFGDFAFDHHTDHHFGLFGDRPWQPSDDLEDKPWESMTDSANWLHQIVQTVPITQPQSSSTGGNPFGRTYTRDDIVNTFKLPSTSSVQRYDTLTDKLHQYSHHHPKTTSKETPEHLSPELEQQLASVIGDLAPLNVGLGPLKTPWTSAVGSKAPSTQAYTSTRSSNTVRNAVGNLKLDPKQGGEKPELHHGLKKSDFEQFAVDPKNLFLLNRGKRDNPGQHDEIHRVMAAKGGNRWQYALQANNVVMDRVLGLGAFQPVKDKNESRLVKKHL